MLELSWRGTKPLKMNDGSERKFINDGDTVIMRGHCEKDGLRIGFGEVRGEGASSAVIVCRLLTVLCPMSDVLCLIVVNNA
jgi:hypothetical protein